jgi:enoyl-CoA hydratase
MIGVDLQDGVLTLVLRRAKKANALTRAMLVDLDTTLSVSTAAVMILTGEGQVFSAGADLTEMEAGLGNDPIWSLLSQRIANFPGLTIAALNGTMAGGAIGMVLACDLRISVPSARFFYPVMRLGFLPQPDDPLRMAALIGPARTKMLLMAGMKIEADQALHWGLIDMIVDPGALMQTALLLASDVRAAPPAHVEQIKRMVP